MKKDVTTKLAACEASLKRWQTRLKRATTKVTELDRQRRRLQAQMGPVGLTNLIGPAKKPEPVETDHLSEVQFKEFVKRGQAAQAAVDDLSIPKELDRRIPAVAERMTAARKKAEVAARSAMPLTGKAALEAIKSDSEVRKARIRRKLREEI